MRRKGTDLFATLVDSLGEGDDALTPFRTAVADEFVAEIEEWIGMPIGGNGSALEARDRLRTILVVAAVTTWTAMHRLAEATERDSRDHLDEIYAHVVEGLDGD